MADSHVMRQLCPDVYICPTCLHMVRNTPLEERKFTVMVEGDTSCTHTIPNDPTIWSLGDILHKLSKLAGDTEPKVTLYSDWKIPSQALDVCELFTEPITIYSN